MHGILFGLGLLATAIGAAMIGYGIPINEFSLGNTLIIAGTVSATGGLVLIGLAAAVRQLRRIALALAERPTLRAGRAAELAQPQLAGLQQSAQTADRIPFPPRPAPTREAPPPAVEIGNDERLAPSPPLAAEPQVVAESEEVKITPLPPRVPQRPGPLPHTKPSDILAGMRRRAEPPRQTNGGGAIPESEPQPEAPWRAAEQPPPIFDALWPVESRGGKAARATARALPSETHPAPSEPQPVPPEPVVARSQPIPVPATEPTAAPARAEPASAAAISPAPAAPATPQHPVAILKSGVVDGMAYTLYADGSIEAQLPEGIVRFGSIAELRQHIEQNS